MDNIVQPNDYIIVERQTLKKIHKLSPKNSECRLGQDTIDLSSVIGQPFWSTYKMEAKPKAKRVFVLIKWNNSESFSDKILNSTSSGFDNRDIIDDGSSQTLSTDEIMDLKKKGVSAEIIVGTLVQNSKTFSSKTEYSQEKYLKKKEMKYLEFVMIKKPSFRLISECIIGKGQGKALGLRMDTLAQLTTIASARSGGFYMLYETGCQGLVSAALLNAMGSEGTIVHVHAGNAPEKLAVLSMNMSQQRLEQILCINIFNLLDKVNATAIGADGPKETSMEAELGGKRKTEGTDDGPERKKPRWEEKEEKAIAAVRQRQADALLVVCKEHPGNIVRRLLRYLHPARPFVAYCAMKEPLQQLFLELKARSDVTNLRLTESWLRTYQVLPDRTHPDINMSGSGGFLLSGIKVAS